MCVTSWIWVNVLVLVGHVTRLQAEHRVRGEERNISSIHVIILTILDQMKAYKSSSTKQKKCHTSPRVHCQQLMHISSSKELQPTIILTSKNQIFSDSQHTLGDSHGSSSSSSGDMISPVLSNDTEESVSDSLNSTSHHEPETEPEPQPFPVVKSFKYLPHQLKPNNPSLYLQNILISRGYDFTLINGLNSPYRQTPTRWQITCYDHPILDALRSNNLKSVSDLYEGGLSMTACNPYCESILHFAARKSKKEIVQYLLEHGSTCFVDDAGRLPMHDVCWRATPAFDIVTLFLNHNIQMLQVQDRFGACPLDYINPRQWNAWCKYLDAVKNKYWPEKDQKNLSAV